MRPTRWKKSVVLGVGAAFVIASCGSSTKAGSTATTVAAGTATTAGAGAATTAAAASAATTAGTSAATAAGTTTGGTTAGSAGGATEGLVNGVYKGIGDFNIDPKKCPADWNDKQGITDKEIDLFVSLPKSGPLAGFGLLADGASSYFKYINDNGGIGGRNIVLDAKDDAYKPDQTKTNVDEALGAKKYAAFMTVLGTANNLAVWDTTNDECMPHLLNGTGAAQWGDVKGHPWTTGMQLDYFTEASLWAKWLAKEHPEAKTVAELTFNNDFGKSYSAGFKYSIKGTGLSVVHQELHEGTAPNLTNQFTTLAATKADVVLLETTGAFCTQAMSEIEKNTTWKPIVIMSGTCGSVAQFFKPLVDQGLTGANTYIIQNFKDVNDPANASDPFIQLYQKTLTAQGLDPKQTTYATGWIYAWFMTEILKDAAGYQGGLTRGNIMLAARSIQETNPLLIAGLTSKMDGMKDAYLTEGGRMAKYTVTDPKALGRFVPSGDLINLEGQLGTYDTVKAAAAGG